METICVSGTSKARQTADAHFDHAAEALGLANPVKAFMKTPFRAIRVTIPLTMDDGILQLFVGIAFNTMIFILQLWAVFVTIRQLMRTSLVL